MSKTEGIKITPYPDINEVISNVSLFRDAQTWKYGKEMSSRNEAIDFIKLTIDKIKQTNIFQQMDIKQNV